MIEAKQHAHRSEPAGLSPWSSELGPPNEGADEEGWRAYQLSSTQAEWDEMLQLEL